MFSKKVLEKCNKEELIAKLLETYEKIQEKDNIITKLEKDLINYEMQKLTVGHQKETIERMEKDIEFFKTQTTKVIDNLLERQETSKSNSHVDPPLKIYQPKMVPRFAKQLVISDSTFRKVNQHDISQQTAIHSYSSATIGDISNVVDCYSPGAKTETLIVHVGHNSIDKGVSGQEAATQLKETVDKCMQKFKPHRVAISKIGPVKDGCYGRKTNNEEISIFNDHLEMISLELDGSYPWSRMEVLENALSIDDICFDGVHPNNGGIKNLVENIRHYNITHNLPASQNTVQHRKLHRNFNFA